MSLDDFNEDYTIKNKVKNVVVCIYPEAISETNQSHINRTLEQIQINLLKSSNSNEKTEIAFVFGEKVVCAVDFKELDDNITYYLDYVKKSASLYHIWFMGMALLENKYKTDKKMGIVSENYFYILTDRPFRRTDSANILATPRFHDFDKTIILIKSENGGGGSLEDYIEQNGRVYIDTDY